MSPVGGFFEKPVFGFEHDLNNSGIIAGKN